MLKSLIIILLFLSTVSVQSVLAQDHQENHPLSGLLIFSLNPGITFGSTDYDKTVLGNSLFGSGEYFLNLKSKHTIGFRLYFGGQNIGGQDDRSEISTPSGSETIPGEFKTDALMGGLAAIYSFNLSPIISPFISGGISFLNFSPKNKNGSVLVNNKSGIYDKNVTSFDTELGAKISIADNFLLSVSAGIHFPNSDRLDDIAVGTNNDSYTSLSVGFGYMLFKETDSDGDGILDGNDYCPDQKEDIDGFEDEDGCPDPDNDGDGIIDLKDNCPNATEDFDGFLDEDGCPDPDNDGDGIIDVQDDCPNLAEDFDRYQDDDGCPDLDNDLDGILDADDLCPDSAETVNGYMDDDGCPDVLPVVPIVIDQSSPKEFLIGSDETFYEDKAELRPDAYSKLDQIIEMIKKQSSGKWRIEGHMDSKGPEQFIRSLSMRRAETIYNYFISRGLSSSDFTVYGMGDKFPVANNNSEFGRKQNRRVMVIREN